MNEKLVLKDNTEITLQGGSAIGDMRVVSADKQAMTAIWDKLTPTNLKAVTIQIDGVVSGEYGDLVLESETSTVQADGKVLTAFYLREKTEIELLREEMQALKQDQKTQDGAIEDLGAITSVLAEQVEGGAN